jgi:hypothetical protein
MIATSNTPKTPKFQSVSYLIKIALFNNSGVIFVSHPNYTLIPKDSD